MLDLKRLGENIRKERMNQYLTQEKLAEKAGISDNYLSKIERGAGTSSLQTIYNISCALNVSIDSLIANNEYSTEYNFINSIIELNNLDDKGKDKFIEFISMSIKYFKQ